MSTSNHPGHTAGSGIRRQDVGGRAKARSASARPRRWHDLSGWLYLVPVVAYLAAFYAYPLYRNVDLSVRNYTVQSFITGQAPFIGLGNFRTVVADPTFWPAVTHTVVFTLVSIAFQYSAGLALAVFFHGNFRLGATLRALFLVPWLLPLIVSSSTWSWMLNSESGVVNYALGGLGLGPFDWLTAPHWALASVIIANVWIGIPFNLVILYSGLQTVSEDVLEAAALDGAGGWRTFWHITFPLLRPVSAITILLGLVYTLKVFDIIWIMTRGGPGDSSTTLSTWSYQQGFGSLLPHLGPAAATGNVLVAIALLVGLGYVLYNRRQEAR